MHNSLREARGRKFREAAGRRRADASASTLIEHPYIVPHHGNVSGCFSGPPSAVQERKGLGCAEISRHGPLRAPCRGRSRSERAGLACALRSLVEATHIGLPCKPPSPTAPPRTSVFARPALP